MSDFQKFISESKINEAQGKKPQFGTERYEMLSAYYDEFGEEQWNGRDKADVAIRMRFGKDKGYALRYKLVADGWIEKKGNKFVLSSDALKLLEENGKIAVKTKNIPAKDIFSDEQDNQDNQEVEKLARGVKDVSKLRSKRFIVPKVGKNSKYLDQIKRILSHMKAFARGTTKVTYMLAGDPGTGKTSFVKSLSTLTGIPLVIIEAPHITQEHIINIPFLVIDGPKTHNGNVTIDDSQNNNLKVVQAESNLVTQLKSKRRRTDQQIQREINKSKVLRDIQPLLGNRLEKIKSQYNAILFLDEFYRTSSVKIRNILRNILNGKIGNDKIPQGVYIIMATNVDDDGVDGEIPLNQQFQLMDYDISTKDDFMSYMYSKHVKNPDDVNSTAPSGVEIKPEVWNAFMTELTDKDLGFNDQHADVRLSPRRLEQIILCVDAALPVRDKKEAANLMTFITNNLSNYLTDSTSLELEEKFHKIVQDLIIKTSPDVNIQNLHHLMNNKTEWRSHLQHEIELKIKLGENRKYVPVVSGQPGIGKTTEMASMAKDMNMGFIQVDVSNLTPEDITGMPIADINNDEITTNFSEPNLYISIMKEYNQMINQFKVEGRKYNIIVLFDEMNRASVPVFNAIRKVLLEKEFENVKLPDDVIITGAINPHDAGAMEFTSHTRDVLDIIPSAPHFDKTMKYIEGREDLKQISSELGFDITGTITDIMTILATEFKSSVDVDDNVLDTNASMFWWNDGATIFYVSPREMTECVANTVSQIEDLFDDMGWDPSDNYTDEEFEEYIDAALNTTSKIFMETFAMIELKHEMSGFINLLGNKIIREKRIRASFDSIKTKKSANVMTLVQILESANGDITFLDKSVIGNYIRDFSSTEMIHDIATITDNYISMMAPGDAMLEMLVLTEQISSSLKKINASGMYKDQLQKYIAPKIINIMESNTVDVIDVLNNDKFISRVKDLL